MPRPTTKADLIEAANKNFETLEALLGSLSDEEKCADIFPNERDKTCGTFLFTFLNGTGF